MTVSTTNNRVSYSGDGSTTSFAITFQFFSAADLLVYYIDSSGNVTDWALTSNYTVTGGNDATGTLTALVAPASGYTLLIVRSEPYTQEDHFIDNDPFDATVMEQALDLLCVQVQQAKEASSFAIAQPASDTAAMTPLPNAAGRAGKQCVFDASGNPQAVNSFGTWRGTWATATEYVIGDIIIDGAAGNNTSDIYTALKNHTSGTFSTDLAAGDWSKAIDAVALGAVAGALASASLSGTSTTSLTVGTGSQTLTTQASKNFNVGAPLFIVDSANTANWMAGQVTSYNSTSGALVVSVSVVGGSGTIATWNIYVSGYTPSGLPSGGTIGQVLAKNSSTNFDAGWVSAPSAIEFVIDGGGAALTTGIKGYLEVPFACTVSRVTLLADQSGSVTIDIWKCTYAQFDAGSTHPVIADSITASATPAIATATKYQDSTLTGWTTSFSAGDILAFDVKVAATSITRCTVSLLVART